MFNAIQLREKLSSQVPAGHDFCVALSGGLDSVVLLHALKQCQNSFQLRAIHINHGLSPFADQWEKHCEILCETWAIPLVVKKMKLTIQGESIEAVARAARYEAIKNELSSQEILLTAHTQNDQAETLLLQLLRGAGPKGMAAMPEKSKLGKNDFLRPLLNFTRLELEIYAKEHQLSWVDDESNEDRRFDRNFIRHEVLPDIYQRWPQALKTLHRAAENCAEASVLMEELAAEDLDHCRAETTDALKIEQLSQLSFARQKNVIRYWLRQLKLSLPDQQKLHAILNEILPSRQDAQPLIQWQDVEIRRFKQKLYAMSRSLNFPSELILNWDIHQTLVLPQQLGTLMAAWQKGQGIAFPETIKTLQVRLRCGGERMHPHGRQGSHPLKKLFQEWRIPPWLRDRIPLIYFQDELVAVPGYAISAKYHVAKDKMGLVITWAH